MVFKAQNSQKRFPEPQDCAFDLPVNVAPMSDLDNADDKPFICNGIENAVIPLPDAIAFLSGEFLAPGRARFVSQRFDGLQNTANVLPGDTFQVFRYGFSKDDFIGRHRA